MRIQNSLKNIIIGVLFQFVVLILGFLTRKIFLDQLGVEYLGINGLLTNVLTTITLIESGIGMSIVYNLYKPLAHNNKKQIISLIQLYKKAYFYLALLLLVISILLYPVVVKYLFGESNIPYLEVVYFIFVFKNILSYINGYKFALINADQKGYILTKINIIFHIIMTIMKIFILIFTQNYILFLVIEFLVYAFQLFFSDIIVKQIYPYIKTKEKYGINPTIKKNITKNVKAMFLHNVGKYCVFGTDNILIGALVNIQSVGIYSNYSMITGQISALIEPILNGVGNSIGNLIATEKSEKSYFIFEIIYFANFIIYSIATVLLFNLLNPFLTWWIGEDYLLDNLTILFILINFYLNGMRISISIFKSKAGLFTQDKYAPLIEGVLNLVSSILLAKYFGLVGILAGTTLSTLCIVFWNAPRIVYKYLFKVKLRYYFIKYIQYTILTVLCCFLTGFINRYIIIDNLFVELIIEGFISLFISISVYSLLFFNTKEFNYLFNILLGLYHKQLKIKVENKYGEFQSESIS